MRPDIFHGDPGHCCYNKNNDIVCIIAKMILNNGPGWRELIDHEDSEHD